MASPLTNGGTHYTQERYSKEIVKLMRPQLVVRSEFSRDYEGNPTAGAVNVPVRGVETVIGAYNVLSGKALTQSATTYLNIPVNKDYAINELVDKFEASAVPDGIVAQRLESAAYIAGKTLELNAINELETYGTVETSFDTLTASTAYKAIKNSVKEIKKLGVDINKVVVFVDPDTEGMLLEDTLFANSSSVIGAELLREGVIGKINGAKVKMSPLLSVTTDYIVVATEWAQAIDEFIVEPAINNLADGVHIGASALQGRMIYEDKLTNALACRVKKTTSSI
jgi:hypothetical protein